MTDIITEAVQGAEAVVEALVTDAEELFPPKPGGVVDKYRRRKAEEQAAAEEAEHEQERIEQRSVKAVKVAAESPEVFSAITYTIAAGQFAAILPSSAYRFRAVVNVVTAAATVVLAKDASAALGQAGFTLATGIALPLYTRAQVYAFNPGGAPVQVSVLAELYAPEK